MSAGIAYDVYHGWGGKPWKHSWCFFTLAIRKRAGVVKSERDKWEFQFCLCCDFRIYHRFFDILPLKKWSFFLPPMNVGWTQRFATNKQNVVEVMLWVTKRIASILPSAFWIAHSQFSSVQLLSHVRLFVTPWTAACQASHHQLPEFTQTHVHWVSNAIQPSHPLSSPSPAFNLSQHQGLFLWVSSSHWVAKDLAFQLRHQSLQWILRTNFL